MYYSKERPMPEMSRRKLARMYRRYAKAMDWTTHARAVELHVDLWLSDHAGAMGPALDYDAEQKDARRCRRRPQMALAVLGIAVTVVVGACVFH